MPDFHLITYATFLTADHTSMVNKFTAAMAKLAVLGHNPNQLVDCSEVIPVPKTTKSQRAVLPAGKSRRDIQAACAATPFPVLSAAPGEYESVPRLLAMLTLTLFQAPPPPSHLCKSIVSALSLSYSLFSCSPPS